VLEAAGICRLPSGQEWAPKQWE